MNRRGFLGSILALGAAPAIVRAESLMTLWVPSQEVVELDYIAALERSIAIASRSLCDAIDRDVYGFAGLQWTAAELEGLRLSAEIPPAFVINRIGHDPR